MQKIQMRAQAPVAPPPGGFRETVHDRQYAFKLDECKRIMSRHKTLPVSLLVITLTSHHDNTIQDIQYLFAIQHLQCIVIMLTKSGMNRIGVVVKNSEPDFPKIHIQTKTADFLLVGVNDCKLNSCPVRSQQYKYRLW